MPEDELANLFFQKMVDYGGLWCVKVANQS